MIKPLKIFIVGPAYPLRGGPAQLNENLCRELCKSGHDAQIISYALQYPSFLFPGSSQFEKNAKAPDDIIIHTLINTINPINWFKTASFIKKQKPDFILFRYWLPFFGPSLGTVGRLVRKNTKVLALTDNVIPHEKRVGDKLFTRYFINACHGFITMSQKVQKDLLLFKNKAISVYSPHPMYETYGPPISTEDARKLLGLDLHKPIVLFFGLIRHYKGLDILLEAMAFDIVKSMDVRLLIAGEFYEDKAPYLKLIEEKGLKEKVILHDKFIDNEMVSVYFCSANLVAQTYRNATNSGVTMVGYYYNKPMLVSNVGGLKEIVPHRICGYAIPPEPKEIASSIADFFTNNREIEMQKAVAEEKKKYQWPSFINKLLELYNRCS